MSLEPNELQGPQGEEPAKANPDDCALPGSLAWIRQITLRQIVKNPNLIKQYPRILLEKPWILLVLFVPVSVVLGITSGVQQGGSLGGAVAIAAVSSVMACVIAAIVVLPVCLVLWSIRWMVRRPARQKTLNRSQKTVQIGEHSIEFEHRRFPFRPNRFLSVLLLLLVTGGEAMFCYMAIKCDSVLFVVMAVLGTIGPVGMGVSVFRAFFGKECVVLTGIENHPS